MKNGLSMYRVYGHAGDEVFDEYCEAVSAQRAADRVREWFKFSKVDGFVVDEVAKVLKGWK